MLLQFTMKNVLSFRDETTLDMTAVDAYKEHPDNLMRTGTKENCLRVAAVYGANAGGKSNLFLGIVFFKRLVAESLNNPDEENRTALERYYAPYSFEEERKDSEFQIVLIAGDYEYRYGFSYNAGRVTSEWLYRSKITTNRQAIVFERDGDALSLGASVRKACAAYIDQIPKETLALSFFNKLKLKTEVFHDLYEAIGGIYTVDPAAVDDTAFIDALLPVAIDREKEQLMTFLRAIDVGILDISYERTEKKGEEIRFYTIHRGMEGRLFPLNLYDESAGTLKSIVLYIFVRMVMLQEGVMVVDELDVKLHPLLMKFFVDLFYEGDSKAQLIYTTHDTTLMDRRYFRRDQIWFVQKDTEGRSRLTALSDYRIRSDASFGKDYLAGVYGAIPELGEYGNEEETYVEPANSAS